MTITNLDTCCDQIKPSLLEQIRKQVFGYIGAIIAFIKTRWEWRERRLAFRTLLSLDDRQLQDIGYRRDQIEELAKLPLSINAALKLQELKAKNNY